MWCRHQPSESCGSQRLVTTVEARACRAIIADSRLGWLRCTMPARSSTPNLRTCSPTCPPSPTHGGAPGAATRWSPSWSWRQPRCWPVPAPCRHGRVGHLRPQPVRAARGARRDAPEHWAVPAEATIRRTLGRLDAHALAAAGGACLGDTTGSRGYCRARCPHTNDWMPRERIILRYKGGKAASACSAGMISGRSSS